MRTRIRVSYEIFVDHDTPTGLALAIRDIKTDPYCYEVWHANDFHRVAVKDSLMIELTGADEHVRIF
jgi:hypothetical protein